MAVLTPSAVKAKVVKLLPITDIDVYSDQLDILVSGAISKLEGEGLPLNAKTKAGVYYFSDGTGEGETPFAGDNYCACASYQVLKDMDYDVDMNFMTEQYITRVNTLRCNLSLKQH